MLEVKNLSISFGGLRAVDGFNLKIEKDNLTIERNEFFVQLDVESVDMNEKYSEQGYIRLWIQNSPNGEKLKAIRDLLRNPKELRRVFDTLYEEERQK